MTETYVINFYPIFKMTCVVFAIVGAYSIINNIAHILERFGKDKLDNKKGIIAKGLDAEIIQKLIDKYPDVKEEYITKPEVEQNIENNQEIHDLNKRLIEVENQLEEQKKRG
jgi:hypothetical protein